MAGVAAQAWHQTAAHRQRFAVSGWVEEPNSLFPRVARGLKRARTEKPANGLLPFFSGSGSLFGLLVGRPRAIATTDDARQQSVQVGRRKAAGATCRPLVAVARSAKAVRRVRIESRIAAASREAS